MSLKFRTIEDVQWSNSLIKNCSPTGDRTIATSGCSSKHHTSHEHWALWVYLSSFLKKFSCLHVLSTLSIIHSINLTMVVLAEGSELKKSSLWVSSTLHFHPSCGPEYSHFSGCSSLNVIGHVLHPHSVTNSMAYGTRSFNVAFTRAYQYSLSSDESTQFLITFWGC